MFVMRIICTLRQEIPLTGFHISKLWQFRKLICIESGFDQLPASRRAEAFRMNQGGWNGQANNLAAYVG